MRRQSSERAVGRAATTERGKTSAEPSATSHAANHSLLELQRLAGNRAVTRLVASANPAVVQRGKMKTQKPSNLPHPYKRGGNTAIITGRKGKKADPSQSGSLISRSGTSLYGDSEFRPIGPEGYGSGMHATIPDWNHTPEGSTPSVKPSWWPTGDKWWQLNMVQGHLLNENLGGPGNDLRNLAPISKKTNSEHLHQVEKAAKKIAIDEGGAIIYMVDVLPGPPTQGSFAPYESDVNEQNRHLIAKLPLGFECNLQDENGKPLVSFTVLNRLK